MREKINLIKGDCLERMNEIESGSIDMVLTSPPYDNLRDYGKDFLGWGEHIWKPCLDQIYRTLKDGGVCVWIVGDATIKGSETGTSFKQALYAKDIGFNLHDTMIYKKKNGGARGSNLCYWQSFEYMFIFSKGRPKSINLICDKKNVTAGKMGSASNGYHKNGTKKINKNVKRVKDYSRRDNVWEVAAGNNTGDDKTSHPAVFPEKLAFDQIVSWSNEGDVVLDPFMGSGTSAKMAFISKRKYIGIEIDDKYFEIAKERLSVSTLQQELF